MRVYHYTTPPEDLLEEICTLLGNIKDSGTRKKLNAIQPIIAGVETPDSQSRKCQFSARTLHNLRVNFDTIGVESFSRRPGSGAQPKLTAEQQLELKARIAENKPNDYGYNVWNSITAAKAVKDWYGVNLTPRTCLNYLHKLDFSLQRPTTIPDKAAQYEEKRAEFRVEVTSVNANPNYLMAFEDEVHFFPQTTIRRAWLPIGSNLLLPSSTDRSRLSLFGTVIPETGRLFISEAEGFNYATTIAHINAVLQNIDLGERKLVYVLDNASWHVKAINTIQENAYGRYTHIKQRVEFLRLPPYSPDLNPIEQVWRLTRYECTHNVYFKDIEALREALHCYFESYFENNETLKTLCSFQCFAA